jgi:hypothetical protein
MNLLYELIWDILWKIKIKKSRKKKHFYVVSFIQKTNFYRITINKDLL